MGNIAKLALASTELASALFNALSDADKEHMQELADALADYKQVARLGTSANMQQQLFNAIEEALEFREIHADD